MRLFAVLIAICTLSQTAIAETSECKAIADSDTRLACYDRTTSPAKSSAAKSSAANSSAAKSSAVKSSAAAKPASRAVAAKADDGKADAGKYVDSISAEDALMNARLKNICRGC
jgi:type VI secretion system VasI family protein